MLISRAEYEKVRSKEKDPRKTRLNVALVLPDSA